MFIKIKRNLCWPKVAGDCSVYLTCSKIMDNLVKIFPVLDCNLLFTLMSFSFRIRLLNLQTQCTQNWIIPNMKHIAYEVHLYSIC